MIDKHKNSKNIHGRLADAIRRLRKQEGIIIEQENGKKIAIYPTEFLNINLQKQIKPVKSKTLIKLAKMAGLLPALANVPLNKTNEKWPIFLEKLLKEELAKTDSQVFETARAKLPIKDAEDSVIVSFRTAGDDFVHLAILIGKAKKGQIPLVRAHSSCVTGDLLGSLRCDCGDQLKMALEAIKCAGYGVLLYMNQEGRGIGITNKIRAYMLQDKGMDTYEANHALGFEGDERDFATAGAILKSLGINEINLLSNNPHKVAELRKNGITIAKRISLVAKAGKHNKAYISAKTVKAGHIMSNKNKTA